MAMKDWEKKVLAEPGAADRVERIQRELTTAIGLELIALFAEEGRFDFDVAENAWGANE